MLRTDPASLFRYLRAGKTADKASSQNQLMSNYTPHYSLIHLALLLYCSAANSELRPDNFVNLLNLEPTIHLEMRYASSHNFLGRPVHGYETAACWLTEPAANALATVHRMLAKSGLGLVIFDCYRPQHAVNDFIRWASQPNQDMKANFYPRIAKNNLFSAGYIAERSGHSRGSTVDLTLIQIKPPLPTILDSVEPSTRPDYCQSDFRRARNAGQLDFGSDYDCFDILSHTENNSIGNKATRNRQYLVNIMQTHGFSNYHQEWWHFTFKPEPYPESYFDFPITAQ